MGRPIVNGGLAATNSTTRTSVLRKINAPTLFPCRGLQIRVRIHRKSLFCHSEHLLIPARVAEGSVNSLLDSFTQRLRFAGARRRADQTISADASIDFYSCCENAALGHAECLIAARITHSFEDETAQTSQPFSCRRRTSSRISGKMWPGKACSMKSEATFIMTASVIPLCIVTISPHISSSLTLPALYST